MGELGLRLLIGLNWEVVCDGIFYESQKEENWFAHQSCEKYVCWSIICLSEDIKASV